MSKITVRLTNRWQQVETIPQTQVIAVRNGPTVTGGVAPVTPPVVKITNATGRAEFDPKELPDGKWIFSIIPKENWSGEVGPDVAAATPPRRIFRALNVTVEMRAGVVVTASVGKGEEASGAVSLVAGREIRVAVQPVWMKSPAHQNRGATIDMIVVHHTDCNRQLALDTFMSEKGPHYMIDTDGQILKLVQESQAAWHAGPSFWAGHTSLNSRSIGIEIVNTRDPYTEAQYTSLLALLKSLLAANPGIDPWNIVGHSDVSLGDDGILGRKSGDPGSRFEWKRVEQNGWGLIQANGPWSADIYGGFFSTVTKGSLRVGDDDAAHKWGGEKRHDAPGAKITGSPVKELQQDLKAIGYSVGTPDGGFGLKTFGAVRAIQEHFFAGGRGAARPDGKVDEETAKLIRSVASMRAT